MKRFEHKIVDNLGIHARPAGEIVKLVKEVNASCTMKKGNTQVDMKKLLKLMGLGVKCGDIVEITVDGEDEDMVCEILMGFFQKRL